MTQHDRHSAVQELFRLCAELKEVSGSISGSSPSERKGLSSRKQNLLGKLLDRLEPAMELPGCMGELRSRYQLGARHMFIVVLLMADRIAIGPDWVSGRSILRLMSHETFDLLRDMHLLHERSPLFRHDILRSQGLITDSPLEGEYRIAEWVFRLFAQDMASDDITEQEQKRPRSYMSSAAHLVDLRQLVELYQIRAAGVFDDSCWREYYPDADCMAGDISPMILKMRSDIAARESRHSDNVSLPIVSLREEFSLGDEEEIVLLAALFHELFTGPPLLDASELVRLVSADEDDLFRKRRLLSMKGRLRENNLVIVENEIEGKDYMGEAYIAAWVEDRLLEGIDEGTAIDAKECRTFQRYLKRLRNSADFYRNL